MPFLFEVIEEFLKSRGTRDLVGLLKEMRETTTWKNSPKVALLSKYADLSSSIVEKATQGGKGGQSIHLSVISGYI